jgi:hypothetical protein
VNSTVNVSIGMPPFMADLGRIPLTPLILVNGHDAANATRVEATSELIERLQAIFEEAMAVLGDAQGVQKEQADRKRRAEEFEVDDLVWLSSVNIRIPAFEGPNAEKVKPKYIGPLRITEKLSGVTYRLELPESWKIHPVFHISKLKRYVESPEEFGPRGDTRPHGIVGEDGELEYEVEDIMRHKRVGERDWYLVKWMGYPIEEASWVPAANLANAQQALRDFKKRRARRNVGDDV